jgi:hypothetical protein
MRSLRALTAFAAELRQRDLFVGVAVAVRLHHIGERRSLRYDCKVRLRHWHSSFGAVGACQPGRADRAKEEGASCSHYATLTDYLQVGGA